MGTIADVASNSAIIPCPSPHPSVPFGNHTRSLSCVCGNQLTGTFQCRQARVVQAASWMAAYGYLRYLLSCSVATPSHISVPLPCITSTILVSKLLKMLLFCDRQADASHVDPVVVTFVRGSLKRQFLFKKPEASTSPIFKSTTSSFLTYSTPPTRQPHPTMSPSIELTTTPRPLLLSHQNPHRKPMSSSL